jgi:hypothetical protein
MLDGTSTNEPDRREGWDRPREPPEDANFHSPGIVGITEWMERRE